MATAFQMDDLGNGDIVMITDYGTYESQVVMLAGLLAGATVAALDYNLKKSNLITRKSSVVTIKFIII